VEGINVDDVEFGEDPNSVFVDTMSEYNFSHSAVSRLVCVVRKLDEL